MLFIWHKKLVFCSPPAPRLCITVISFMFHFLLSPLPPFHYSPLCLWVMFVLLERDLWGMIAATSPLGSPFILFISPQTAGLAPDSSPAPSAQSCQLYLNTIGHHAVVWHRLRIAAIGRPHSILNTSPLWKCDHYLFLSIFKRFFFKTFHTETPVFQLNNEWPICCSYGNWLPAKYQQYPSSFVCQTFLSKLSVDTRWPW